MPMQYEVEFEVRHLKAATMICGNDLPGRLGASNGRSTVTRDRHDLRQE
jgi:hypothetical protein